MGRGPSYPYVDLEQAIALTRKMYDYTKRAPAPVDSVISEAWKYSATSSSGQKVLAALKAFGLIEDASGTSGRSLKLTQRAIRILLDDMDSDERRDEIKKSALSPKWYDFCWKTWGKEMPASMRSNLLIEHGFVDSTVEGFLKDYRKSISFAGLLDEVIFSNDEESKEESNMGFHVGEYIQWESQGILRMPAPKKITHFSEDQSYAFVEGSLTGIPVKELIAAQTPEVPEYQHLQPPPIKDSHVSGSKKVQLDTVTLAEGITLHFQWPSAITAETYEDFLYQLEGIKRRIARSVQKVPLEQVGTPMKYEDG